MIEEITSPPFLDETAQEMVNKLQAIANNINNNAGQVSYSNTTSQLQAETVQTAIDEVKGITDTISSSLAQLENNGSSGAISLDSYNTSSNKYTIPYDGYVQLSGGSATSGYIRVFIETSNGVGLQQYMVVTNSWTYQTVFVKKGFKVYVAGNTVSGGSVSYVPLDS